MAVASASAALAQPTGAASPGVPSGCTYATCALRVEAGLFSAHLVRGASGDGTGGRLTDLGAGVDALLAGPDSAASYGRAYVRDRRRASGLGLVATIGYVVVLFRTNNFRGPVDDASLVTALASAGFAIGSLPFAFRAQRSLSRGVWWFNAALPR